MREPLNVARWSHAAALALALGCAPEVEPGPSDPGQETDHDAGDARDAGDDAGYDGGETRDAGYDAGDLDPSDLCEPCTDDEQCHRGACLIIDGEGRCASPCESDAQCPSGTTCAAVVGAPDEETFCLPLTGSCTCGPEMAGAERVCSIANEHGVCHGVQTCDPTTGWGACSARTPAPETCNGVDDDCNGLVDDDVGEGDTCENSVPGVGTCYGELQCDGAEGLSCSAASRRRRPVTTSITTAMARWTRAS